MLKACVQLIRKNKNLSFIVIASAAFSVLLTIVLLMHGNLNSKYKSMSKLYTQAQSDVSDLNKLVSEQESEVGSLKLKNEDLAEKSWKMAKKARDLTEHINYINEHFGNYWHLIYALEDDLSKMNGSLWASSEIDEGLLDMLQKHVKARYSRDEKEFLETIVPGLRSEPYCPYSLENEKHYRAEIRIIATKDSYGVFPICVVYQKNEDDTPSSTWFYVHVVNIAGKWYVQDYT